MQSDRPDPGPRASPAGARPAHLDLSAGIAGDMLLAALLDAGAGPAIVSDALSRLDVGGLAVSTTEVYRAGLRGRLLSVHAGDETPPLRRPSDLVRLLAQAGLDPAIETRARSVLDRLAQAEARVHGCDVADVHFHEIGAIDTLTDVVGVCVALADLGVGTLTCGPVATGRGTVVADHGRLPVPAPAVLELLHGFRIVDGGIDAELTTPTGAALLAEFATQPSAAPDMVVAAVGYGAGQRELAVPNLLRVTLGDRVRTPVTGMDDRLLLIEATVDDLTAELVPWVLDRLREAGALDAWAVPAVMKKGRPGHTLTALAEPHRLATLRAVLFREATTLGVRWHEVDRLALARSWREVVVEGCIVRVKVGHLEGDEVTLAPEADDVLAAARTTGLPARVLAERATRLAADTNDGQD